MRILIKAVTNYLSLLT